MNPLATQSYTVSPDPTTSTQTAIQHHRLAGAAQQFEGMLLQELLKPMRERGFCLEEDGRSGETGGAGDTLSSYGTEALATAIARGGGLGIASHVVQQVERERTGQSSPKTISAK